MRSANATRSQQRPATRHRGQSALNFSSQPKTIQFQFLFFFFVFLLIIILVFVWTSAVRSSRSARIGVASQSIRGGRFVVRPRSDCGSGRHQHRPTKRRCTIDGPARCHHLVVGRGHGHDDARVGLHFIVVVVDGPVFTSSFRPLAGPHFQDYPLREVQRTFGNFESFKLFAPHSILLKID